MSTETFHTERRGETRRAVLAAVRDDAIRYFDGAPFERVSLTVERDTVTYAGRTEYAAAAVFSPTNQPEGA